jgi:hypothetical protein
MAYEAARWQAEHGQPELVIDLCRSVIEPPVMTWNWASMVLPCLEWSATALVRVGDADASARAHATREQLRSSAIAALQSAADD